jgi:hypothetical protein
MTHLKKYLSSLWDLFFVSCGQAKRLRYDSHAVFRFLVYLFWGRNRSRRADFLYTVSVMIK